LFSVDVAAHLKLIQKAKVKDSGSGGRRVIEILILKRKCIVSNEMEKNGLKQRKSTGCTGIEILLSYLNDPIQLSWIGHII